MELGERYIRDFITENHATGSVVNADSTPIVNIFENESIDPMAYLPLVGQRGTIIGQYYVNILLTEDNGFQKGSIYNIVATFLVSGTTIRKIIDAFIIKDAMEKLTNVAAIMNVPPIPDSFSPTGIVAKPADPGTIADMFPPNHEFFSEISELYDPISKTWKDKAPHSAEAESLVAFSEAERTAYANAYSAWKQEYDIQRDLQWKAYVGQKLITLTE